MLVDIIGVDKSTGVVECNSPYGKLYGKWCSESLPALNHYYNVEIDIPQVIFTQDITVPHMKHCGIEMQKHGLLVSAMVIDQDDYSLSLRLGCDILLIEVGFTTQELFLQNQMIGLQVSRLSLYDIHLNG